MSTVTLSINEQQVTVPRGTTVLEAARSANIYIPTLCFGEGLEPYGACRMCIVEIEGMRGLPTSCTTVATEGMVVSTDTENVNSVRRTICEMLISDHPADCLSCSSNQRCELQKVASYLGVTEQRLPKLEREAVLDESNPFFTRDLQKCILCGLCTRACHEIVAVGAIEIAGRGYESRIASAGDSPIRESNCVSCGECVDRCPTGALSAKFEILPPTAETRTTCPYCGVGCSILLGTRNGRIVKVRGDREHPVNRGNLCVKGRFGMDFVGADDRLTKPLIRKNGKLEEAEWDEALDFVAENLRSLKEQHGPDALAGLSSAKCTNEENYVFQKFVRSVIGTNNVDHCARLCHSSTVAGLARAFGSGAMTNSIDEFLGADCIFVIGSNTTETHPVISLRIKAAARNGARLIIADPRKIDLVEFAELHVRQKSGTDVALANAMINVIISEGMADNDFIASRTEGFEAVKEAVKDCTPEWAEPITGIAADDIRQMARIYGSADRASIVFSMGITQHTSGTDNVLTLANLAMLTGNVGRESTGVNPLRGQNNVQGACDLGALPNVYPGYQKVDDPAAREKFEHAWGTKLPDKAGLTVMEMMNAADERKIKGLYIMGENPMLSDANINHVREALQKLDFLCVQDIFLTETAELADVVLPAASFAEKDGSFTNTERRVQRVRKLFDAPGEARLDWEIVCDIATRLGVPMRYAHAGEILDEIASVSPIYGGMSFERIDAAGLQWPCPDKNHPGTKFLHKGEFRLGKGKFHVTSYRDPAEMPDNKYPFRLTTGRMLYHFHTGTMSRRSPGLEEICPPSPVEINPADAEDAGISHDDAVEVATRRGTVTARAVVTEKSPRGTIFMPFHFREGPANALTNDALDPIAKIPEYKVCAARIARKPVP